MQALEMLKLPNKSWNQMAEIWRARRGASIAWIKVLNCRRFGGNLRKTFMQENWLKNDLLEEQLKNDIKW